MSYDLAFYAGDMPASAGYAVLAASLAEALGVEMAPTERIAEFETCVRKRWPEGRDSSPWAAPVYDTATGNWLRVSIERSEIEDMGEEIVELAHESGLLVLDPQEREVIAPD